MVVETVPILWGLSPLKFIVLVSAFLSLVVTLVYKYSTDQVLMKELKKELKRYKEELKRVRSDPDKMKEINSKMMKVNSKYMMQSFKPMIITILPFLAIFSWLKGLFNSTILIPLPFWEGHLGWIGTYILFSMIFSTLLRKLMKVA